jgi:hypothetical protein
MMQHTPRYVATSAASPHCGLLVGDAVCNTLLPPWLKSACAHIRRSKLLLSSPAIRVKYSSRSFADRTLRFIACVAQRINSCEGDGGQWHHSDHSTNTNLLLPVISPNPYNQSILLNTSSNSLICFRARSHHRRLLRHRLRRRRSMSRARRPCRHILFQHLAR